MDSRPEINYKLPPFCILDTPLPYSEFFANFLVKNIPCLIKCPNETSNWAAMSQWATDSVINFNHLSQKFGRSKVSLTDCTSLETDYLDPKCESMSLEDYLIYFKSYVESNYSDSMPCLYLKDWHMIRDLRMNKMFRDDKNEPYEVPSYFSSDWLNEGLEEKNDDFRFVYMGPKGTWTPFHCDVYGSFSWSVNVYGTKKWHIYPIGAENIFKTGSSKCIKYESGVGKKDVDYYEVIQGRGEIIFIPSGYHHIVWNLTDVISINHNWMNGSNILFIWSSLQFALSQVEAEINDLIECEDFYEISQKLLQANHGMNYADFTQIILIILSKRKKSKMKEKYLEIYTSDARDQIEFDIKSIVNLVEEMKKDSNLEILLERDSNLSSIWSQINELLST